MKKQSYIICLLLFLSTYFYGYAQDTVLNKYGLWVIAKMNTYKKTVKNNPDKQMVDLQWSIPGIKLNLRYADINNFMHTRLYSGFVSAFLRRQVADSLKKVQAELSNKGLCLVIFDAYRPYSVTEKMWEMVKDDRYAANPKNGSGHNRGAAVDLSIIEVKTGKELDMGTGFDNFSDTAHHNFSQLPEAVLQNRLLLKSVMEKYGFKALETEWWHYFVPDLKKYELLDITFKHLRKLKVKDNQKHYIEFH